MAEILAKLYFITPCNAPHTMFSLCMLFRLQSLEYSMKLLFYTYRSNIMCLTTEAVKRNNNRVNIINGWYLQKYISSPCIFFACVMRVVYFGTKHYQFLLLLLIPILVPGIGKGNILTNIKSKCDVLNIIILCIISMNEKIITKQNC